MAKYRKFIVALGAACGVAAVAVEDGTVTTAEWVSIAVAFLGALGVYQARNEA